MPIYEYECPKCGVFEAVQKVSEKPLRCNPDCQEKDCPKSAERLVSASAFHLKGGGWYKTDYAASGSSGGSKKKASGDTAATSESKSADAASGDAKSSDSKDSTPAKKGPCGSGCGCH